MIWSLKCFYSIEILDILGLFQQYLRIKNTIAKRSCMLLKVDQKWERVLDDMLTT